jgi:hypothetical protein
VYRLIGGQRCPFSHEAVFSEFNTGQQKWQTMPFQMIAKVAEAFALRKAFPTKLGGLHIEEESGAFEDAQVIEPASEADDDEMELVKGEIKKCNTQDELMKLWKQNPGWHTDATIPILFTARKNEING